jgi:ribosome-associated protein
MITVTSAIQLADDELRFSFVRASGPGGQNVNKVSTAVELRFDARNSPAISDDTRTRLMQLAGRRLTKDGEIVLFADRFRTQERNRQDAIDRLVDLIRRAAHRPAIRRATKPTLASKKRRLDSKKQRGHIKALRRPSSHDH